MPFILIAAGLAVLTIGGGLKLAGDGIEESGNGALKLAGAAALGVGAWLAFQRLSK